MYKPLMILLNFPHFRILQHTTKYVYEDILLIYSLFFLKDSEQQMILTARRSLVAKVARHQPPQIDIFFLNINVRRSHLVCDSLNEVIHMHHT